MCRSARLYQCARCHRQVLICSHCDRGNIYCAGDCADLSRQEKLKEAQKRYEKTDKAKKAKAQRQQRYRQCKKRKATHQGSTITPLYDLLLLELEKLKKQLQKCHFTHCIHHCCHFCGAQCQEFLRLFFLAPKRPTSFPVFSH
jgi:hypothetical protein